MLFIFSSFSLLAAYQTWLKKAISKGEIRLNYPLLSSSLRILAMGWCDAIALVAGNGCDRLCDGEFKVLET